MTAERNLELGDRVEIQGEMDRIHLEGSERISLGEFWKLELWKCDFLQFGHVAMVCIFRLLINYYYCYNSLCFLFGILWLTSHLDISECLDINECRSSWQNRCSYKPGCINTQGSYRCTCPGSGYILSRDQRTCNGEKSYNFKIYEEFERIRKKREA